MNNKCNKTVSYSWKAHTEEKENAMQVLEVQGDEGCTFESTEKVMTQQSFGEGEGARWHAEGSVLCGQREQPGEVPTAGRVPDSD